MGLGRLYTRTLLLVAVIALAALVLLPLFLAPNWPLALAWIGGAGAVYSGIGVIIAIWQVVAAREQATKARESADRAANAAARVLGQVQGDLRGFLAAEAVRCFQEGMAHKDRSNWALAQIRFGDCEYQLIHLASVIPEDDRGPLDNLVRHMRLVREEAGRLHNQGKRLNRKLYEETARLFWELIRKYHVPSRTVREELS